tara:strand:+ start:204 stop:350 length:147 start_codon:yes stop_codon:yes gene_type:complete
VFYFSFLALPDKATDRLLRMAIQNNNLDMVKLLVQQGACIHVTDLVSM